MLSVISFVGNSVLLQFPHRQPRALQERPGLIGKHIDLLARLHRRANHAQRRPIPGRRQRSGVAVRQHRLAVRHQRRAVPADGPVDGDVFEADLLRLANQRRPDLVQSAARASSHTASSSGRSPRTGSPRWAGSSPACRRSCQPERPDPSAEACNTPTATPIAAATPIAGAPRITIVLIASATSS